MGKWLRTSWRWGVIVLALACAGCTPAPDEPTDSEGDLSVVGLTPLSSAPVAGPLVVEFDREPDLGHGHFLIARKSDGNPVALTCACGTPSTLVVVTPLSPLEYGTTYTLTVTAGLPAVSGEPLAADWPADFTTESFPGEAEGIAPFDVVRHGIHMNAVAGNPSGWIAVGDEGLALVSVGGRRYVLPTGTPRALRDVAMPASGTVYVGYGDGTPEHPEGGLLAYSQGGSRRTLLTLPDEAIVSVSAVSDLEAYAISPSRLFRERQAVFTELLVVPTGRMNDLWAFADDALWIAGVGGLYNGNAAAPWETVDDSRSYTALGGLDATTVVALSHSTATWVQGSSVGPANYPTGVWNDVSWFDQTWGVMVGYSSAPLDSRPVTQLFRGESFTVRYLEVPEALRGVCAWRDAGRERAVAVGECGRQFAYAEETDTWVGDTLPKKDGEGDPIHWTDLAAGAGRHLYALRDGGIRVHDGISRWWEPVDGPATLNLTQLHADHQDFLYATGIEDGGIDWFACWHDGAGWSTTWMSSMDEPRDLWGFQEMREGERHLRLFVACDYGLVYMLGGISTPMTIIRPGESMGQHLRGIWGTTSESVWVVGENGTIAHYRNPDLDAVGTWTAVDPPPTTEHLNDVWGSSENHLIVVGDRGTILTLDGSNWVPLSTPGIETSDLDLVRVWTDGPDNIWAATASGVVLHYDGAEWHSWETGIPNSPIRALMYGAGDLWLAGERDLLLRFSEPLALPPVHGED